MKREYYFCDEVTLNTWEDFTMKEHMNQLAGNYEKITGYGWDATFSFNHNGQALYINENDEVFKGVWFELNDRKIAVFKR